MLKQNKCQVNFTYHIVIGRCSSSYLSNNVIKWAGRPTAKVKKKRQLTGLLEYNLRGLAILSTAKQCNRCKLKFEHSLCVTIALK